MIIILLLLYGLAYGQLILEKEVYFDNIKESTIDANGNLYLVSSVGDVAKYAKSGDLLGEYSAIRRAEVSRVISTSQFKTILFHDNLQKYTVLNRYLSVPITYDLRDLGVNFATDMAVNQQNFWFIDIADFSLKLFDTVRGRLVEEKSLAQILSQAEAGIAGLKSYRSQTYLIDRNQGVYVFDNMGNFIVHDKSLVGFDIEFHKDEMYYQDKGNLVFKDMYSKQVRIVKLPIALEKLIKKIWVADKTVFVVEESLFKIYKYLSD